MKKKDITYQDKLGELRLDIGNPNNKGITYVLLEGETDVRLFRKLFNIDKSRVENIPGGNSKVEDCVEELLQIHPLMIGIRDSDFLRLDAMNPYNKVNMFLTDFHDMEMTLISKDYVFSAVVFEFIGLAKEKHNNLRDDILVTLENVSYLKWLNMREKLEFDFKSSGFVDLILVNKSEIDFPQYFARVLSKSPAAKLKDGHDVFSRVQILKKEKPDAYQICNGHDFVKVLAHFVKTLTGKTIADHVLASCLRLTFTEEHYKNTELFTRTLEWAEKRGISLYA